MLTLTGLFSWLRALTCSDWGHWLWREYGPVRQVVLYEKNFGWLDVWELNSERWDRYGWGPERLWGGIIWAEGLHDWGMQAVPLFSYTLAFALQLRKSTGNLSQGSKYFYIIVKKYLNTYFSPRHFGAEKIIKPWTVLCSHMPARVQIPHSCRLVWYKLPISRKILGGVFIVLKQLFANQ
jgi:hypothetical protein